MLHVDYGNKRVDYPHLIVCKSSNEMLEWCRNNFKPQSYYFSYDYRGCYFVREKDATLFALKWV